MSSFTIVFESANIGGGGRGVFGCESKSAVDAAVPLRMCVSVEEMTLLVEHSARLEIGVFVAVVTTTFAVVVDVVDVNAALDAVGGRVFASFALAS